MKEKLLAKAEKLIAKAARKTSKMEANSACMYFGYQEKTPDKLRKLRKF
ncbi:MAG: cyclic lactone autoinducer peptide [Clostridiales bacterium]|nr:cyclic lactone autoinducer peptide [Clostridiales bacterium]